MATLQELMRQRIESLIRRRTETDRRMGYIWMIIPLLPVVATVTIGATSVGIIVSMLPRINSLSQQPPTQTSIEPFVGGIVAIYALAALTFFIVWVFGALSFYYLIDRRNAHFDRQRLLFAAIHRYLESRTPESENVSRLGYLADDSATLEHVRPAGLWTLLFLFFGPITGLIASYNLTQDLRKHDELQSKYQTTLALCIGDAGFVASDWPVYKPRNRDPMLFIILSAITGGLFWIYWYYTLLKDYNCHFEDQAKFEDKVLATLTPPQTPKACTTCGGSMPSTARFCPNCGTRQTT